MAQAIPLFANPGQTITISTQIVDGYGDRIDGYVPKVMSIYNPAFAPANGYPLPMSRLDVGLYVFGFTLPKGTAGLGTFIISVLFNSPATNLDVWQLFQVNCALPFGNSSISPL